MLKELLLAWPLMLAAALVMNLPEPDLARLPPAEPSWQQQLAAVRAGKETYIVVDTATIDDIHLRDLAGLSSLKAIELGRSELTLAGVQQLATIPRLERVTLRGRPVDDAMLAALCGSASIQYLNLPATSITDRGLTALERCPQLLQLRIGGGQITDAGMAPIARLPALRFLHLIHIKLTDRGLATLADMQQLESLYIDGADISDVGVEQLLKRLPGLHFHLDQAHHDSDPRRGTHEHP